ncbi:MAG: acetone carboxylase subunit gamma [Chloroflexi bacterium]|nr:acetone carboxylase subunit gamma [Chloroflexota bacterium]
MRADGISSKEKIKELVEGKLPWEDVKKLITLPKKDKDRFRKYVEILQARVPWKDRILLRISEHLYIVSKGKGQRVVKCDCGQEFGDCRVNWKFNARVRVRRTREEMREVISMDEGIPNPDIVEMREFYCPGCYALLAVEVVPIGYPPLFEMMPDIDAFYREWLGTPLDDEQPSEWFCDKTSELTAQWGKEG